MNRRELLASLSLAAIPSRAMETKDIGSSIVVLYYPNLRVMQDGTTRTCQDIALEILKDIGPGSRVAIPDDRDVDGNRRWELQVFKVE